VVAERMVLAIVAAPALGASQRAADERLGAVQQVAELDGLHQVGVVERALVGDRDPVVALAETAEDRLHLPQALLRARIPFSCSRTCASGLSGSGGSSASFAWRAASSPARRPNTTRSRSEFVPRRLAPWTLTHAHSPAAYSPGTAASSGPVTTRPSVSVGIPPIA